MFGGYVEFLIKIVFKLISVQYFVYYMLNVVNEVGIKVVNSYIIGVFVQN